MENCLIWSEGDVYWNNNEYYWNLCQVVVEVVTPRRIRGAFVDPRKKRHSYRWEVKKDEENEEKRYIKLTCFINDEMFEEEKYIGKRINVESFDEELIITEIKKINVSVDEVTTMLASNPSSDSFENIKIMHLNNIIQPTIINKTL
jgi:hypothetical protein